MPSLSRQPDAGHTSAQEHIEARDRDWVERVRTGDAAAFEQMFRAYADPLYGFAYNLLRSREAAEEVVQDLFLRIWAQRDDWEVAGTLKTYLFKATRNRAISHLRHQRVEHAFRERAAREGGASSFGAVPEQVDEGVQADDLAAAVAQAVTRLPERCRQVFTLSREQHLTYAQIAAVLQISVKTVEIHMGRALTALRATLASWEY